MIFKKLRPILYPILSLALVLGLARLAKTQTDGFTLAKVSSSLPYHPEWETPPYTNLEELRAVLSQPFHYLAKGAQSFVFASEDGKYVLKLFRHHHMRAPLWLKTLPFRWAKERAAKLDAKLGKDFGSYLIASSELPEETALVFLHLNKTGYLGLKIPIIDKIGVKHLLDADSFEFLVQRRATLLYPAMESLIEQNRLEAAKVAISDLLHLLRLRGDKGISDKDPDLNTNFGLLDGRAVQIDIGRFKREGRSLKREELIRITDHFQQWLRLKSPELDTYLQEERTRCTSP